MEGVLGIVMVAFPIRFEGVYPSWRRISWFFQETA
jgi:hypothetical protein